MVGRRKLQFGDVKADNFLFNFLDAYGKPTPCKQNSLLRLVNSFPFVFFLIYCFVLKYMGGNILFANNNIPEFFLTYPFEGRNHIEEKQISIQNASLFYHTCVN